MIDTTEQAEKTVQNFLQNIDTVDRKQRVYLHRDSQEALEFLFDAFRYGEYDKKSYELFLDAHKAGVQVYDLKQQIEATKAEFNLNR